MVADVQVVQEEQSGLWCPVLFLEQFVYLQYVHPVLEQRWPNSMQAITCFANLSPHLNVVVTLCRGTAGPNVRGVVASHSGMVEGQTGRQTLSE